MFVVKGARSISSHQYAVQNFYKVFFCIPIPFLLLPLRFHFSLILFSFSSFLLLHFYTSAAVDTCSLRLPIFCEGERMVRFWKPLLKIE